MDKIDEVLMIDFFKKQIFVINPASPLVKYLQGLKILNNGLILLINPQDIKIIETENGIEIKVQTIEGKISYKITTYEKL